MTDIQITGKNMEILPSVRDYINTKLGKVNRQLSDILAFEVVVTEESTRAAEKRIVVQVTINNHGTLLRAEERGPDARTTIDKVAQVLERQVEHYKGKLPYANKRSSPSIRTLPVESAVKEEVAAAKEEPRVVKWKKFDIKPMSVDESIDQMELLGHDFYMFYNDDNNQINLIYRRKDGNYGLIEPSTKK